MKNQEIENLVEEMLSRPPNPHTNLKIVKDYTKELIRIMKSNPTNKGEGER